MTDEVLDALAVEVAEAIPQLVAWIPADPAAVLGRLGASPGAVDQVRASMSNSVAWAGPPPGGVGAPARFPGAMPGRVYSVRPGSQPGDPAALVALRSLSQLLAERLLGALETRLDELRLAVPPGLPTTAPRTGLTAHVGFASGSSEIESETVRAVSELDQEWPAGAPLISALLARLAAHPVVVPVLAGAVSGTTDEVTIAVRHGAAHLALAVATTTAVLRGANLPAWLNPGPSTVVGCALGAAAVLLAETPMPATYADALLARRRAEYRLPRSASGTVDVRDHRFALVEGAFPATAADFAETGLVEVVPGGVLVRTGSVEGPVRVTVRILAGPPPADPFFADGSFPGMDEFHGWDEVVEVSWIARKGLASLLGPDDHAADAPPRSRHLRDLTPPWPGEYRVRVLARDRDYADSGEAYELVVWSAPAAAARVVKRTDRLGHRLRGEVEPAPPPEAAYRWASSVSGVLGDAATVTVVSGATVDDVLRAFGADLARPVSLTEEINSFTTRPSVAAVAVAGAGVVLAIEDNGFEGSTDRTLLALSRLGPTASMFWNVNAVTRLSLARDGEILASAEPGRHYPDGPEVAPFLAGLDLANYHNRVSKGLVVVERFTGYGLRREDVDRIRAADVAYLIGNDDGAHDT